MKKLVALMVAFLLLVSFVGFSASAAGNLYQNATCVSYQWAVIGPWRASAEQKPWCSLGHSISTYTKLTFGNGAAYVANGPKVDRAYPSSANSAEGYLKCSCLICGIWQAQNKPTSHP